LHFISYIPLLLYLSGSMFFICKCFCRVLFVLYAICILVFFDGSSLFANVSECCSDIVECVFILP
jgi:hypothetical protein